MSAFLRGVERRGLVVALLQCGDEAVAGRALGAVLRAFRSHAGETLMASWPVRFWGLLAVAPGLRAGQVEGAWPEPFAALAGISADDRLALLLRIVAGLDEPMAADVLGITEDDYRLALARACPRDATGRPDASAWRALAEAAQAQVRELSRERLERALQSSEAAIAGVSVAARENAAADAGSAPNPFRERERPGRLARRSGRRGWIALLIVLLLVGVAVLAWWWRRPPALPPDPISRALPGALHVVDSGPIRIEELPSDDDAPASAALPALAPADAAMLADPELALARQADFYAWVAAGAPVPVDESDARPIASEPASAGLETISDEN
ncbi:MAG: hypothetical protein QM581_00925 [Pseudomonas sp.]